MNKKEIDIDSKTNTENYVIDGIHIETSNEGLGKDELEKINKFTVEPIESDKVTVFTAILIDDRITKNHTLYNKQFQDMLLSLPHGEGNFTGTPVLFGDTDHEHAAAAQVGRVFDAWSVVSEDNHYGVMAKLYILNDGNEDLITKVNSGVLKEVSIATKVELPLCSICNQSIRECSHEPGKDGCHVIMSGGGFVAEVSFVAIPGSNAAKILSEDEASKFIRLESLKDAVVPLIRESLEPIQKITDDNKQDIIGKITEISEKYDKLTNTVEEIAKKLNTEGEVIGYKIDYLTAFTELKEAIDSGKEFVIKHLAKFNIQGAEFRSDAMPELSQGLKGEDVNMIVKLLYDNTETLGYNLTEIEKHLKVTPLPTNAVYTGDITNVPGVLRFLVKKTDDIKVRILKLQGKFDLEQMERQELIVEATKYGIICGKFGFNEKNLTNKFFEQLSTDEIRGIKDKFFEAGSVLFTPEIVEMPEAAGEPPKDETKIIDGTKPKATLKEIATNIVKGGRKDGA